MLLRQEFQEAPGPIKRPSMKQRLPNRTVTAAMVRRGSTEAVEFDRTFWARAGHEARFAAAWEMVQEISLFRGQKDAIQSRLQRSVCAFQPRSR
jgi:hypothetical protein